MSQKVREIQARHKLVMQLAQQGYHGFLGFFSMYRQQLYTCWYLRFSSYPVPTLQMENLRPIKLKDLA